MKKTIAVLLCHMLVLCLLIPAAASAGTPGFGKINAPDVAIRKEIRGQKITRLQDGTLVFAGDYRLSEE